MIVVFNFLFFHKCSIKPVTIQLTHSLWTVISVSVKSMLIKRKLELEAEVLGRMGLLQLTGCQHWADDWLI